jgi:hypothetical protein
VSTRRRGERLPKECLVVIPGLPAGENVAVSKRWCDGLEITQLNFGDTAAARLAVRRLNAAKGTTAAEEHAMLAGACFGWHVAHADPRYLLVHDGRFIVARDPDKHTVH